MTQPPELPDMPEIRYARDGEAHIAYMTAGRDDDRDLLLTPGIYSHVEGIWGSSWVQELTRHARVTWYDKRGTGASDPAANFTFEERIADILAVMDAACIERAHLYGGSEGGPMSILFATMYPERVLSLTLYGTYASLMRKADYPNGLDMSLRDYSRWVDRMVMAYEGDPDALQWMCDIFCPTLSPDPGFRSFWLRNLRKNASPGAARTLWEMLYEIDVRHLLPAVRVPTTIVHATGDRLCHIGGARYLAEHIPGARFVELPGDDHWIPVHPQGLIDAVLHSLERGEARAPHSATGRRLATVLFSDMVSSTEAALRAGDAAWRQTLDQHDGLLSAEVSRFGGELVKTTGDGILATFEGPSSAVRCGIELHRVVEPLGIRLRVGMHAGEIETRGSDVAGVGVAIAARVASIAGAGETLVSSTVKDLVIGAGFHFQDRGTHALKGVPDEWRIFSATR